MNLFEEKSFIQPIGNAIMLLGCLGFFLLSFGVRVGSYKLEGRFFFSSVCGVESGLSRVDTRLSMQVLLGVIRGVGGEDLFSFQLIGGPKLRGDREDFFFSVFPIS
jgi:hypothetical protein